MGRNRRKSVSICGKCLLFVILLVVLSFIIIISSVFYFFRSTNNSQKESTLRFVSIIHRHGERAPEHTYPRDPYNKEKYWPEGLGSLLQKGKLTMFELGTFLRDRYDGFISPEYKVKEISVFSSYVDRCLMSAQLVLAGLYPPIGNQIWNSDLLWQPIPIRSSIADEEDMICVTKPCAALSREKQFIYDNFLQKILDENKEFVSYLSQKTGSEIKTYAPIRHVYDNLQAVEEAELTVPKWARDIYPEKLRHLTMLDTSEIFASPLMTKLNSGVLINEILFNMKQKTDPKNNFERRISLYSAHDKTIIRLLRGMNVTDLEFSDKPRYGAALFIELHKVSDSFRVKMLYKKNSSDTSLTELRIRGCDSDRAGYEDGMCNLNTFSSALQPMKIIDFEEECRILD